MPPVKGRPRKLPHYANRGKTSSSGGELASARSCFSTVRTALGKLRITGLLAQFDIARSFPQFPRPLLLQPTILTSERGTRFGIRKAPNHVPPPHLPDDPKILGGWQLNTIVVLQSGRPFSALIPDTLGNGDFSGSSGRPRDRPSGSFDRSLGGTSRSVFQRDIGGPPLVGLPSPEKAVWEASKRLIPAASLDSSREKDLPRSWAGTGQSAGIPSGDPDSQT